MSSGNIGRSSFAVGASGWALTVLVAGFIAGLGCHKESSHRVRHAKQHNNAATTGGEEEAPAAPPAPTANVVMPPGPAAPPPPAAAPAHELTVESSVPVPMPPRRAARHVAVVAPPRPAPEPAPAPARRASARPSSGGPCGGGTVKGELLSVQGVAADDVLNVREAPDKSAAVLGGLPPDATGVHGTANRRRVGASTWREVECGSLRGWVNERFLAPETSGE
jgi:hypothetical protein